MTRPNGADQGPGKPLRVPAARAREEHDGVPLNRLPAAPQLTSRERRYLLRNPAIRSLLRTAFTAQSEDAEPDSGTDVGDLLIPHDEVPTSSSSASQTREGAQQSVLASSSRQPLVKKRRRLSLRPDMPELARRLSNRALPASLLDRSNHSQMREYIDAQAQISGISVFDYDDRDLPAAVESLLPSSFDYYEQQDLQSILHEHASYFRTKEEPLLDLTAIPGTKYPMPPSWDPPPPPNNLLGVGGRGWPANKIPIEILEQIASSLSRGDLLSMRLVNHEFEAKISRRIFQTVVVPFKPDIYGMADCNNAKIILGAGNAKGKSRQAVDFISPSRPISDGMEVFRSWGQTIKKFAMTFELDDETFNKLPAKDYYEDQVSFWGNYKWPRAEYTRFKSCEVMEKKADETRCMTLALSYLKSLNELGLVVESGLGWLSGPDCSDRVHISKEKQRVFGATYCELDRSQRVKQWTWDAVTMESRRNRGLGLERFEVGTPASERAMPDQYESTTFQTIHGPYYEPIAVPKIGWAQAPLQDVYQPLIFRGLDVERGVKDAENVLCNSSYPSDTLVPNELKYSQIEWLMENEWAQQAFLTSLTISVTDNANNLRHIQTMNIAKMSSRYLPAISNRDFWAALPGLRKLKMFVLPDWRDIVRGPDELLQAAMICPSSAGKHFFNFLETCIASKENITSLDIGWLGGGERATGLFARNQHILPAPVLSFTDPEAAHLSCKVLKLPFVRHLALTNCWFHPSALKVFVRRMEQASLETLKLDSVSLTAQAGPATAGLVPPVQAGNANIQAQAAANILPINFNFQHPLPGQIVINNGHVVVNNLLPHLPTAPPLPALIPLPVISPVPGAFRPQQGRPVSPNANRPQDVFTSLNTFHSYMQHPGRSVVNAPVPAGGHPSHWATEQPAPENACLEQPHRVGSWGEVIDKITPGKTIDEKRVLLNDSDITPKPRKPTSLQQIEFISCGYVRLTHHRALTQNTISEPIGQPPRCLRHRHKTLSKIMMKPDHDVLLGTIAPAMPQQESDVLQVAFGMRMGWDENDMSKYETREDGQAIGGSGRFSGVATRGGEPVAI